MTDLSPERPLWRDDVRLDAPVEWLGEDEARDVLSAERRSAGHILSHGHPGRITSTAMPHVQVDWLGLEDEPVSFAVGFGPDEAGRYRHLGMLTEEEWADRSRHGWWASPSPHQEGP